MTESRSILALLVLAFAVTLAGCEGPGQAPTTPDGIPEPAFAKPGSEAELGGDVVAGDGDPVDPWLTSDCPGRVTNNFGVLTDHTLCMVVWPTGSDYPLIDDVSLQMKTRKGGREITEVQLRGQDAIGSGGIQHESEVIVLDPPVATDPNGFTLDLNVDQLPVWRLDGHTGGNRVEVIGTVAIGKVVYRDVTGNAEPTADFSFSCAGLECDFDGAAASDSDGTLQRHAWHLGEDALEEGVTITRSFPSGGTYDVTLYVTDEDGGRGELTRQVTVEGTTDGPPSVSVTEPADGATVAGAVTVTADASDDGAVTQVEFFADGASLGVDSDGSDGWSGVWNSADAADGEHTLSATATDDAGQTASDQVTVTSDNVDDPPTVAVTNPADGSTVSGVVEVTADASDDRGVTQVELFADGASLGVDSDGSDGWSASWDTRGLEDGSSHTLSATATDDGGQTASSAAVTVTADNSGPSTLHVGDLDGSSTDQGRTWTAVVDALVLDDGGNPVAEATVSGSWSGGGSGSAFCTTGSDGRCAVSVSVRKNEKSVTFTVEGVAHAELTYDATANTDPDGDSDGTTITVGKP